MWLKLSKACKADFFKLVPNISIALRHLKREINGKFRQTIKFNINEYLVLMVVPKEIRYKLLLLLSSCGHLSRDYIRVNNGVPFGSSLRCSAPIADKKGSRVLLHLVFSYKRPI